MPSYPPVPPCSCGPTGGYGDGGVTNGARSSTCRFCYGVVSCKHGHPVNKDECPTCDKCGHCWTHRDRGAKAERQRIVTKLKALQQYETKIKDYCGEYVDRCDDHGDWVSLDDIEGLIEELEAVDRVAQPEEGGRS